MEWRSGKVGKKLPEHNCGKKVNHGRHSKVTATKYEGKKISGGGMTEKTNMSQQNNMKYDEKQVKDIRDCNAYRELPLLMKPKGRRTMEIRHTSSGRNMDMMLQCRNA